MGDGDRAAFAVLISALLETNGQEATKPRLEGYWLGLRDLSLEQLQTAVEVALKSHNRVPSPSELRVAAFGGNMDQRAVAAWGEVQRAAYVSYMADLDFEDYIINAVIRNLGGRWNFFDRLNSGADAENYLRLDFMKCYAIYASREPSDEACAPLIGMASRGRVGEIDFKPRVERIRCSDNRGKLLPPRECVGLLQG